MYSHLSNSESLKVYGNEKCQPSSDALHALHAQRRARSSIDGVLDLPQPLEPKLTNEFDSFFLASSDALLQRGGFQGSSTDSIERRHQIQCMPGHQAILMPKPHTSPSAPYSAPLRPDWVMPGEQLGDYGQHSQQRRSQGEYIPLALHSRDGAGPLQHNDQPSWDQPPIAVKRWTLTRSPQSARSSYTAPFDSRDGSDRQHKQFPSPFITGRCPSPNLLSLHGEPLYASPDSTFDRKGRSSMPITGLEDLGKYLGVEDVRGEGTYHVYEDGKRIPTQVDGKYVNPAWGLTKSMKPRKRLALACLECRKKKIKCESAASNCTRCEKAKRPCRRYVDQGHVASMSTPDDCVRHVYVREGSDVVSRA